MTAQEAYDRILAGITFNPGAFYGEPNPESVGVGLLVEALRIPAYDEDACIFRTVGSLCYVLTHECDVAQENDRPAIESVVVCPVIPLEKFIEQEPDFNNFSGLLGDLAKRGVYRMMYIPPLGETLKFGGVLYLNYITSTHISAFGAEGVRKLVNVSALGLREVDYALMNLFFREKADQLWGAIN